MLSPQRHKMRVAMTSGVHFMLHIYCEKKNQLKWSVLPSSGDHVALVFPKLIWLQGSITEKMLWDYGSMSAERYWYWLLPLD